MSADSHISYSDAIEYWASIPPTVDGVLGGYGNTVVPKVDIMGSNAFLHRVRVDTPVGTPKYALDVGAGIGRITRDFLSKVADKVDLLEPVESFVNQAKTELQPLVSAGKIGQFYTQGMQDFVPEKSKYSVIWCQWCVGHLPDAELIKFFNRCVEGLVPGGVIIVKENNAPVEDDFDETDSSVTRTDESFRNLFAQANLNLILSSIQKGLPKELYPVQMYALRPFTTNDK